MSLFDDILEELEMKERADMVEGEFTDEEPSIVNKLRQYMGLEWDDFANLVMAMKQHSQKEVDFNNAKDDAEWDEDFFLYAFAYRLIQFGMATERVRTRES